MRRQCSGKEGMGKVSEAAVLGEGRSGEANEAAVNGEVKYGEANEAAVRDSSAWRRKVR